MIMNNAKSKRQIKKGDAKDGKSKLPQIPPPTLQTSENSLVSLSDYCSEKVAQISIKAVSKMDNLKIKFTAVENVFRFYQGRGQLGATYDELKQAVERTSKKQFTTEDIGRLLRLVPDLYEVKWVQKRKKNAYDDKKRTYGYELQMMPKNHVGEASLQFMKREQGSARATLFNDRVKAYTNAVHRKWCREQGMKPLVGRYHPEFELECIEVKPKAIPTKPQRTELSAREALLKHSGRSKLVSKAVQQRLAKLTAEERSGLSSIVRESMARYNKAYRAAPKQEEEEAVLDMSKIPESLRSLPRETLLKLQGKSKARQILKVDKTAQDKKKLLEQLPELVRVIKVFFRSSKRTAMPYRVLVVKIAGKLKSKPSPVKTQQMLDQLCKIVPEFCETQTGVLKIFKLKRGYDSSKVFRKITKAIKEVEL